MQLSNDPNYSLQESNNAENFNNYLLHIGDDNESTLSDNMIQIPDNMVIPSEDDEKFLQTLIKKTYLNLSENISNFIYIIDRAILTTKNKYVDNINQKIINQIPGETIIYHSYDSVLNDTHNLYQSELLNSLTPSGLPPHELCLKIGTLIMCLRNLDLANGLCNGMRLICCSFQKNVIEAEIATGNHQGKRVFLP